MVEENPEDVPPKTNKRGSNPNSLRNLKQFQDAPVEPEIVFGSQEEEIESEAQAEEITRGRKLSPELVKKLLPKRGALTPAEKKRYNGVVVTFLSDFKNEEPTAFDVDDILEIAQCDILEMRLLEAAKVDPAALVSISQTQERIHKRKQAAKANLANRRIDRKDARSNQDINIVDLVVRFDNEQKRRNQERVNTLLQEEEAAQRRLKDVLEKDG